jgi:hypothetical protein
MSESTVPLDLAGGTLPINFDEVPDVVKPIPSGIYDWQISRPQNGFIQENKDKNGYNLVLDCKIVGPPGTPDDVMGREKTRWISVKMQTEIKRLCLSAGVPVQGQKQLPVELLNGKIFKASMRANTYKDKQNVVRESTDWDKIFIPADPEYATGAPTMAPATA